MSWLSPYRWLLYGALIAALWGWHWNDKRIAVNDAIAVIQAEQTAAALAASEKARAVEAELQTKVRKVSHDYQTEKKRRAADAVVTAGRLSELQAALDSASAADTATSGGVDDPRNAIIHQCTGALVGMDEYAKGVADKASGLQSYAREVCVAK